MERLDGKRIRILRVNGDLLRHVLKLPENCEITGLSHELFFDMDGWALRVESPDFSVVPFNHSYPPVDALYAYENGLTEFIGWKGEGINEPADQPAIK